MLNNQLNDKTWLGRWGTEAQGTHCREGETGHNVSLERQTRGTSNPQTAPTKLQRIAELAIRHPEWIFTSLAHLIDFDLLHEVYRRTRKDAGPGLDGVTAREYSQNLEEPPKLT